MNGRFPVLSILSILMRVIAVIGFLAAIVLLALTLTGQLTPDNLPERVRQFSELLGAGVLIVQLLGAIVTYAGGEAIALGLAVERNTRQTAQAQAPAQPKPKQ